MANRTKYVWIGLSFLEFSDLFQTSQWIIKHDYTNHSV